MLYSGRHQFHDNLREMGLDEATILEQMGHSSVINNRVYGGARRKRRKLEEEQSPTNQGVNHAKHI